MLPPPQNTFDHYRFVSIGFASISIRSPVSFFGHTFLIGHNELRPEPDSLVIEFSGDLSQSSAFAALISSVHGGFYLKNFQDKIREYDAEDRSIWTYRLELDPLEKARLSRIANDEIGRTLSYSFMRKNCAYMIFGLLEQALSDLTLAFDESFVFTLPIQTLRRPNLARRIRERFHFPSSLQKISAAYKQLPETEQNTLQQLNFTLLPSPQISRLSPEQASTIGLALNYLIAREPNPELRNQYFLEKKRFTAIIVESVPESDPLKKSRERYAWIAAHSSRDLSFSIGFQPLQRDFFSSQPDLMQDSFLEALKPEISFTDKKIWLSRFTLFKTQSVMASSFLHRSFVRYLDLAYSDRSWFGDPLAREVGAKIGAGFVAGDYSWLRFGLIPYIDLQWSDAIGNGDISSKGAHGDLSVKSYLRIDLPFGFRSLSEIDARRLISSAPSLTVRVDFSLLESDPLGTFMGYEFRSPNTSSIRFGLNVFF